MTKRLDKAIEMLRQLSPAEQDAFAVSILDRIAGKPPRGRKAEPTRRRLDALVAEADREIDAGETQPLDALLRQ